MSDINFLLFLLEKQQNASYYNKLAFFPTEISYLVKKCLSNSKSINLSAQDTDSFVYGLEMCFYGNNSAIFQSVGEYEEHMSTVVKILTSLYLGIDHVGGYEYSHIKFGKESYRQWLRRGSAPVSSTASVLMGHNGGNLSHSLEPLPVMGGDVPASNSNKEYELLIEIVEYVREHKDDLDSLLNYNQHGRFSNAHNYSVLRVCFFDAFQGLPYERFVLLVKRLASTVKLEDEYLDGLAAALLLILNRSDKFYLDEVGKKKYWNVMVNFDNLWHTLYSNGSFPNKEIVNLAKSGKRITSILNHRGASFEPGSVILPLGFKSFR